MAAVPVGDGERVLPKESPQLDPAGGIRRQCCIRRPGEPWTLNRNPLCRSLDSAGPRAKVGQNGKRFSAAEQALTRVLRASWRGEQHDQLQAASHPGASVSGPSYAAEDSLSVVCLCVGIPGRQSGRDRGTAEIVAVIGGDLLNSRKMAACGVAVAAEQVM